MKVYKEMPKKTKEKLEEMGVTEEVFEHMFDLVQQLQGSVFEVTSVFEKVIEGVDEEKPSEDSKKI
jgi:hypothetical protein